MAKAKSGRRLKGNTEKLSSCSRKIKRFKMPSQRALMGMMKKIRKVVSGYRVAKARNREVFRESAETGTFSRNPARSRNRMPVR